MFTRLVFNSLIRHLGVAMPPGVLFIYSLFALRYYSPPVYRPYESYVHGWPVAYVRRVVPADTYFIARWRLPLGAYEFDLQAMLWNLAISAVLGIAIVGLWRLRGKRRKPWQVTITEWSVVILILSVALGGFVNARRNYSQEASYLADIEQHGWIVVEDSWYHPSWLIAPLMSTGATGQDDWQHHHLHWIARKSNEDRVSMDLREFLSTENRKKITLSPYVRSVLIDDDDIEIDEDLVRALCIWVPYCELLAFYGSGVSSDGIAIIRDYLPQIRDLRLEITKPGANHIEIIGDMKNLEGLEIVDDTAISSPDSLRHLQSLPRIKELVIPAHWEVDDNDRAWMERQGVEVIKLGQPWPLGH